MVSRVPKIKASTPNRPRNAFDLSQRHLFTAHAGMLLPVLSLDLLPHDHVEINASDFMRTMPMNTAAYVSMRGVYEFFFVPYHQLYPQFDQMITGMTDYHSRAIKDLMGGVIKGIPCMNLQDSFQTITSEEGGDFDIVNFDTTYGSLRLLDLLGYGRVKKCNGTFYFSDNAVRRPHFDYNVSLFRLAAYQKIYQDFYRNTQYEFFEINTFSLDKYKGLVDSRIILDNHMFELRYRNAQQDYMSNVRPSQLFSSNISNDMFKSLPMGMAIARDEINISGGNSAIGVDVHSFVDTANTFLNTSSIRSAFAIDKLLRVTTQAGKTFQDQMRAHYGVEIPESRDGKVHYIGGFDSDIQLSDVTQTSGTTSSSAETAGYLGKLTSKGTGSGSGRIVYDAKEHGVLMCIYSLIPMAAYDSTRIDPMNLKINRFDFFTPEFENLGLQPLLIKTISSFTGDEHANDVLGWQPRYSEYKTALDINHGQFSYNDALSYYTSARFRQDEDFPISKTEIFKVNPRWLDSVFTTKFNGTELTDCVYGGCNFNILKVSDMSEDGMPRI